MSEHAVARIAEELHISVEQANAVWLKVRQAMYKTLLNGEPVDLGFAYMTQDIKAPRKRHDFGVGTAVTVPTTYSLKMLVPPHVKDALAGKAVLSPYVFLTRTQFKNLAAGEKDELHRQRLDYYRVKGVSA